jgi:hypothetical protein
MAKTPDGARLPFGRVPGSHRPRPRRATRPLLIVWDYKSADARLQDGGLRQPFADMAGTQHLLLAKFRPGRFVS